MELTQAHKALSHATLRPIPSATCDTPVSLHPLKQRILRYDTRSPGTLGAAGKYTTEQEKGLAGRRSRKALSMPS